VHKKKTGQNAPTPVARVFNYAKPSGPGGGGEEKKEKSGGSEEKLVDPRPSQVCFLLKKERNGACALGKRKKDEGA